MTSYFSEYALLPEHLFHVYLNYFTYDQENKNKSQKKKPLEENMLVRTKRCTHHTHSPSSHTFSLVFFSEFMSMNSIKVAENSVCVCMNSALNK